MANRTGQIPPAGSTTAKIQYAVDFDLAADGRILVADRAANAVEIFSPSGAAIAKIPVFAPTSVVALPNDQFAVATLRSKRLVEVRDDDGTLIRSFGDPADAGVTPDPKQLQNLGKISGDGAGDIFFAFTSVPDPTVRRYDRYGYVSSEATFDANLYNPSPAPAPDDRVQFGLNYSETSFADSYNTWVAVGNRGDIFFGGGLSPGLGAHLGGGPQTAQSATDNILSHGHRDRSRRRWSKWRSWRRNDVRAGIFPAEFIATSRRQQKAAPGREQFAGFQFIDRRQLDEKCAQWVLASV